MSDDAAVRDLARRAGIAADWTNAADEPVTVAVPVLRRLLAALGYPAATPSEIADSGERLGDENALHARAPLVTGTVGEPIALRDAGRHRSATASLVTESGDSRDVRLERRGNCLTLRATAEPGYHALHLDDRVVTLALAPKRCFTAQDIAPRLWGVAVALYGLRYADDGGVGNTAGLSALARGAAPHGADAIALSPTHAMFGADATRYGPYSPSSRLLLNPLYADPGAVFGAERVAAVVGELGLGEQYRALEAAELIDWPGSAAAKLAVFRRLFDDLGRRGDGDPGDVQQSLAEFRRQGGDVIEQHALFEVLAGCAASPPIARTGVGGNGRNNGGTRRARPCANSPALTAKRSRSRFSSSGSPTARWHQPRPAPAQPECASA